MFLVIDQSQSRIDRDGIQVQGKENVDREYIQSISAIYCLLRERRMKMDRE